VAPRKRLGDQQLVLVGPDGLEQSWQGPIQRHCPPHFPRGRVRDDPVDQELHGVRTLERNDPIGATLGRRADRRPDAELVYPLRRDELAESCPIRGGDSDLDRADRPSLARDGVKPSFAMRASQNLHELVAAAAA
jgi:hypothetical protein